MIEPDKYIDEYYAFNEASVSRAPQSKYSNLNFSRLASDRKLVCLKIDIVLDNNVIIRERLDWDLNDHKKSPEIFAQILVENLSSIIGAELLEFNLTSIRNQIMDQLLEHIDKNTYLPKMKPMKKDNDFNPSNQLCPNCNTTIYNSDYCINCMFIFEKKLDKKFVVSKESAPAQDELVRQTDRQRILELRQKNIGVSESTIAYMSEKKEKKSCLKCGEVNLMNAIECKSCKFKFPQMTFFDLNMNNTYSMHFWDKINKNSIIQQLKNFADYFSQQDFCFLKYLYEKVKHVLKTEFEDILTEEAYVDLKQFLDKVYFSFSHATLNVILNFNKKVERVFDSTYHSKYAKARPKAKMLNFNSLEDIKEGWLPDNIPEEVIEEKRDEVVKPSESLIKRKRGRPKKMEIFKNDNSKESEIQITMQERDNIIKTDIMDDGYMHYDFCGRCSEPGKLICCETCSSAYHYECLGFEKFPRGKFKCYFCKIVKHGIDNSNTVDKVDMKLIKKLITFNRKTKWQEKALEFVETLRAHHCSVFYRDPIPEDFTEYFELVSKPIDLEAVEKKLKNKEYNSLKDCVNDLYLIWSNSKLFYQKNSFMYKQADTLERFMIHLIKNEGVFDCFADVENLTYGKRKKDSSERSEEEDDQDEEEEEEKDEVEEEVEVGETIKNPRGQKEEGKEKSRKSEDDNQSDEDNIQILI